MMRECDFVEGQKVLVRTVCGIAVFVLSILFAMVYMQYEIVSFYSNDGNGELYWLIGIGTLIGNFLLSAFLGKFIWFLPTTRSDSAESSR